MVRQFRKKIFRISYWELKGVRINKEMGVIVEKFNRYVFGVKEEKQKDGEELIFVRVMVKYFLKLKKCIKLWI